MPVFIFRNKFLMGVNCFLIKRSLKGRRKIISKSLIKYSPKEKTTRICVYFCPLVLFMMIIFSFSRKNFKTFSLSNLVFCCLIFDLFCSSFISYVKRKANYLIEQQSEGHEKRDRLLTSKEEFYYSDFLANKKFMS